MLDVESAWVHVQAAHGLCTEADAHAVAQTAHVDRYDLAQLAAKTPDGANALIPLLGMMRQLLVDDGAPASASSALHRGATSQDIIDTALMVLARNTLQVLTEDLRRAGRGLAAIAVEHRNTTCIARSLTQHALPTTFGLKAANWLNGINQALTSLTDVKLSLQWGGAVGTLASLQQFLKSQPDAPSPHELTQELAHHLSLEAPVAPWHTNRIAITSLGSALGNVVAALGTFGADVLNASRPEIGEVSEPREAGKGGSSAMPHKQNPVHSVLLRNAAMAVGGHVATLYTAAGQAVDERPDGAWHAEWASLRELLRLAGGAAAHAATLAAGLVPNPEAMLRNLKLGGDAVLSERIATVVGQYLPNGKSDVQAMTLESLQGGKPLRESLREAVSVDILSDDELADLLDPSGYTGVANELIDRILEDFESSLSQ